jgi:predicted DsbA family dithiol-disulfide isomerase
VRVEIWSDVVCPWCYVGTRRFEAAVERLRTEGVDGTDIRAAEVRGADVEGADIHGTDIEVVHRAFELDPTVPPEGMDLAGYLARKFGGTARVAQAHDRLDHIAGDVGIDFRWEGKRRLNTFDAHRLAAWALGTAGPASQDTLHQRLFRAYFTENLDVADHGVLAGLAADVGLDRDAAAEVLATGAYADTVRAEERRAGELDIHAVPTFVIEGTWAIPGAQDVDTFVELLRRARERLAPLTAAAASPATASGDGDADSDAGAGADAAGCDDGACAV